MVHKLVYFAGKGISFNIVSVDKTDDNSILGIFTLDVQNILL